MAFTRSNPQMPARIADPPPIRRNTRLQKADIYNCIESYGNFIWTLAKKFTSSRAEAEMATQEIFHDIWDYAARHQVTAPEQHLISLIARRRLFKHLI